MVKKYILLKDLPTFNAGDIFTLDEDGCLYLTGPCDVSHHWKSRVMAYHKNTLSSFPNILEDWFEEVELTKTERIREMLESLKDEIDNYLEENW